MKNPVDDYIPVYKGLQRPLEVFGFKGRFIPIAAWSAISGFLSFVICFLLFGNGIAFLIFFVILGLGFGFIRIKQKDGLYSKKREKGIYIITSIFTIN